MTIRSLALVASLVPALAGAQGQAGVPRPITLAEAVRLAQRNAPAVVQASGQSRASAAALRSAYAAFLPSLNLTANTARQGGETFFQGALVPFRGDPWSYSRGFTSSLDLFTGGRRWYALRAADANVASADATEALQAYQVALQVKQQYYAVLAARESEAAAQAQLKQAQGQYDAAVARVRAGAATISDSLRSEISLGNAQLALLTARNNLHVANTGLSRLVATAGTVTAAAEDTLGQPVLAVSDSQLTEWAEAGPAVAQARAAVDAARAARKQSLAPYVPTLSLSYSSNGNATSPTFDPTGRTFAQQHATRLQFSFPLFNQLTREEGVVRADVAQRNAEAAFRDARLGALQSLAQSLGALRLAEQRVRIQQASVAAAEEDLRVQSQRYALGASTLLDFLTSQLNLNTARASLIQARFDARVAKAQLEALTGRDLA